MHDLVSLGHRARSDTPQSRQNSAALLLALISALGTALIFGWHGLRWPVLAGPPKSLSA